MSNIKQKQQTQTDSPSVRTEAELESRLATALSIAFPNIPRNELTEQRRFTVRLGHETHEFDSAEQWKKSGRADVIIFHGERPLAVIELKREDLALTDADYGQAQSYANQLTPRPPLLIVTNGGETRIYDSSNGSLWSGEQDAASAVAKLLANSAKLAAADMRWAIEALMGRETGIWVHGVHAATDRLLKDMTDLPGQSGRPFSENLLFPRLTTIHAIQSAQAGTVFTILEGVAQSGKSSYLREFSLRVREKDELAMLMLRGAGPGLFQVLANLFAAEFEWNITPNDTRHWLRRMSEGTEGPILVLGIDDVESGTPMAEDLEELAGMRLGNKLVVTLTTHSADKIVKSSNGRTETAIGCRARILKTYPLCLEEFKQAQSILSKRRIVFQQGAEYTDDYRTPWVLRTIYDDAVSDPNYQQLSHALYLPPALGLELVDAAQKSYGSQDELLRHYRVLARCALADTDAHSIELAFAKANGFVIRQDQLTDEARHAVIELKQMGAVRTFRLAGKEDVVIPTIPAAFLLEFSDVVGNELTIRAQHDSKAAGIWLGKRLDVVYLGDMIGAQAIRSMAYKQGIFSAGIIVGLLSIEPVKKTVNNALLSFLDSNGQQFFLKIQDGKMWASNRSGDAQGEQIDTGDESMHIISDTTGWMIMGQLAKLPLAQVDDDSQRMDAHILMRIGQCHFPLLRVNTDGLPHFEHDLGEYGQVLCHDQAPIEVATQAMADLFSGSWEYKDEWVDEAILSGSLHLLHRLVIALRTVYNRGIPVQSDWALKAHNERVFPALTAGLQQLKNTRGYS